MYQNSQINFVVFCSLDYMQALYIYRLASQHFSHGKETVSNSMLRLVQRLTVATQVTRPHAVTTRSSIVTLNAHGCSPTIGISMQAVSLSNDDYIVRSYTAL